MYQRAGELGSLQAWRNVAAMYAAGDGVPQCRQTADAILAFVNSKALPDAK
jgi:TPR repeat protein